MDSPVTKLIFIAAAVAGAALVVGVMWATLSSNTPSTVRSQINYAQINDPNVCAAAGGTWNAGTKKCDAPNP